MSMRARAFSIVFTVLCFVAKPQQHQVYLAYGYGPSFLLFDEVAGKRFGTAASIGVNYLFGKKDGALLFGAGLNHCRNDHHRQIKYNGSAHVTQKLWGLFVESQMRLNKRAFLRVGILINKLDHTNIYVSYKTQGTTYYSYGYSEMYDNYSATPFQASACAGMVFPIQLKKREIKFGFICKQNGNGVVNSDYYIKHTLNGESYKVLSVKTRPTILLFTIEAGLLRNKKSHD